MPCHNTHVFHVDIFIENEKLLSHDVSEELENFDAVFEREIAFASLQVENSPSRHWQNVLATNKDEKQSQSEFLFYLFESTET